jgi:hypothetical protein
MRYSNLQNGLLISLLVVGVAATAGCSSGSDTPGGAGGSSAGAGGSTGTGGSNAGGGGSSAGTGGSSAGTGGSGLGTGGSAITDGGNPGTGVCSGTGTRVLMLTDSKVDDFEGAMISPGWSSFNDVMPTPNSFMIMQVAGGAVGTAHSGHYAGTGAKTTLMPGGYGVGTIYNVAIDTVAGIYCVDISAFDGLTFWAKAATAGAKVNVNFVLPETNKAAGDSGLGGGDCLTGCYNHPYKTVTLTTDWQQYSVAFTDATMGGTARVRKVIQELGWLSPDSNWDFSLDEIQFYKGTPPTGPVASGDH